MEVLYYNDLDYSKVKKQFEKTVTQLKNGNYAAADIKKLTQTGYYRARLDGENRLLFKFARYDGKSYLLLLEVILHHNYRESRFLNGAVIDESKISIITIVSTLDSLKISMKISAHSQKKVRLYLNI